MKKELYNKVEIKKRSNKATQGFKNEKNIKNQKSIRPFHILKFGRGFINLNEKEEMDKMLLRTKTNIDLLSNKEKRLLLNSVNNPNNLKNSAIKLNKSIKEREKENENENTFNTQRMNSKDKYSKINQTLYSPMLFSSKNKQKNRIFEKKKGNTSSGIEIENRTITDTSSNLLQTIPKHRSSYNLDSGEIISKIKLTKKNRNGNDSTDINNNNSISKYRRKKTLDKRSSENISESSHQINSSSSGKSFYKNNKSSSFSSSSINNKISKTYKKLEKRKKSKIENINNLDIIFENNNKQGNHHYLENTISTKNKMVKKRKTDILTQNEVEGLQKNNSKFFGKKLNLIIDKEMHNEKFRNTIYKINNNNSNKLFDNNSNSNDINIKYLNNRSSIKKRTSSIEKSINIVVNNENKKIFNGKIEDYLITKELGKGSCAVVKLATHKITKEKFAIKIYTKEFLLDPQKRNVVKNEINILKQLDNEYIMKLYEEIDTPNYLYLVLEYINGIPLIDILRNEKNGYLSQKRSIKLMTQVIKGIIYLHDKNIYHRDIKLENILVMKNDLIKIIDFGFAVKCNRDSYQKLFCGTPSYMAPELLNKEKYIPYYSDIWSLGVLFYSMLYGRFPFDRNDKYLLEDNDDFFDKITVIELNFDDEIKVDDNIKNLFRKIFVADPTERIALNEILEEISNIN